MCPTLARLHCKTCVHVCLLMCGHIQIERMDTEAFQIYTSGNTMSGLPHALSQLLSRTVMLKCVKLQIFVEAPYREGITNIIVIRLCIMQLEKSNRSRKCNIPMALMVTLGLMVHCL